jgi:ABC-type sugar transport system permease subunit
VVFALLSVFLTFVLGMFLAIVFDVPEMPLRAPLRSLLLIPYTIPAFVAVPVWVGLLNPQFGVISQMIAAITGGWVPAWFSDPMWAKVGILLIQTWLGFPVHVRGGDRRAADAAQRHLRSRGSGRRQCLGQVPQHHATLLLVTVGPLLVASFAFNFNNFVVINLYNQGGPPMPNVPTPVGYTDILATYTYNIAFGAQGVQDYGYASAITMMIFLILFVITQFQFRFTNMLEERGRNV